MKEPAKNSKGRFIDWIRQSIPEWRTRRTGMEDTDIMLDALADVMEKKLKEFGL